MKRYGLIIGFSLVSIHQLHTMNTVLAHKAFLHATHLRVHNKVPQQRMFMDLLKPFFIVNQQECIIIERLGQYNRTLRPGLQFKWPLIENPRKVEWGAKGNRIDLRERIHDLPKQHVITKDNVEMTISAIVYYKIDGTDPKKSVYEIEDLPQAIERLSQTTLRNIIGSMHFDTTLTSRDQINKTLCSTLDGATDKWGVTVTRVELQEITPPRGILASMEKQMTAERERRALVTEAEGAREALIKRAEGEREATIQKAQAKKTAAILEAEGESEARIKKAQAEADAIEVIKKAIGGQNPTEFIQRMEYIRTLPAITSGKDNKLIIVPHEMSVFTGLLSSAKELINDASKSTLKHENKCNWEPDCP
ncbi:MAG: SPFH domain-containing protein [Candidatus Babeliales bacterium]